MAATDRKTSVKFPELDPIRLALGLSRADRPQTTELQIRTGKAYHGGAIEVSVSTGGTGDGFFTTVLFSDYRATLERVPAKQVRQKAVDKLHDETVTEDYIRQVKQRAVAYYADKINKRIGQGEDLSVSLEEVSKTFTELNELLAA